MKSVWLFRVFDAFNVRGNGWVLLPGVRRDGHTVKAGDAITLRGGKGPPRTGRVRAVGAFAPAAEPDDPAPDAPTGSVSPEGKDGDGPDAAARLSDTMPLLVELDPTDRPLIIGAEVWLEPGAPADPARS